MGRMKAVEYMLGGGIERPGGECAKEGRHFQARLQQGMKKE